MEKAYQERALGPRCMVSKSQSAEQRVLQSVVIVLGADQPCWLASVRHLFLKIHVQIEFL